MMKKIIFSGLILVILFLISFCPVVYAAEKISARVIHIKGDVEINGVKAEVGGAVKENDRIVTGRRSYLEIAFGSSLKNNIRIAANSLAVIKKISSKEIDIGLSSGKIFSLVTDIGENQNFRIVTPVAVAGVRGTGWTSRTDGDESGFSAFENHIFVQGIDKAGNLTKGAVVRGGWKLNIRKFEFPERVGKVSWKEKREWKKCKRILVRNVKSFIKKEAEKDEGEEERFEREGGRLEKIIDRSDSTIERNDARRIDERMEREDNVRGGEISP